MVNLAQRLSAVRSSSTKAMTQKARQLKLMGHDVITLSQGEPDFDTPEHIANAAKCAIDSGMTRYTEVAGLLSLREAIAEDIQATDGWKVDADQITVGCGAKQVVFNALMAIISAGDEVLIPAPYWVSYPDMVRLCDGIPVIIDCPQRNGYKLTAVNLLRAITPKTRCLMLNSPNNPSGAVYSANELAAIADVLSDYPHIAVISDEIYRNICYNELQQAPSMIAQRNSLGKQLVVVNGVSKAYAMTGWRVGFGVAERKIVKAINIIQSQSSSHTCSIAQAAAEAAYRGPKDVVRQFTAAFKSRRDLVIQQLKQDAGIDMLIPDGAFYLFFPCDDVIACKTPQGTSINNDLDMAQYMLEFYSLALVPGSAFGMPGHLRMSYACDEQTLTKACERIVQAIHSLM